MQELLPPGLKTETAKTSALKRDGILAFPEKPSANLMQKKEEPASLTDEMNASELFSLFTANIIKEKIIFTR
ncbi:MAG TPA: hypothetical protein VLM16_07765 [Ginsengibacter sp.]|nr:hypothetical protein [Ginsengibacter sp.]